MERKLIARCRRRKRREKEKANVDPIKLIQSSSLFHSEIQLITATRNKNRPITFESTGNEISGNRPAAQPALPVRPTAPAAPTPAMEQQPGPTGGRQPLRRHRSNKGGRLGGPPGDSSGTARLTPGMDRGFDRGWTGDGPGVRPGMEGRFARGRRSNTGGKNERRSGRSVATRPSTSIQFKLMMASLLPVRQR